MTDTSEVERLRTRLAELEAAPAGDPGPARAGGRPGPRSAASVVSVVSVVLVTLASLLAPVAVVSAWARSSLLDTAGYVETMAPLADDPAMRDAVAARVTAAVVENLDVEGVTTEALESLTDRTNLPPRVADLLPTLAVPVGDGVERFTRDQVDGLLEAEEFPALWAQVNRAAHEQVVRVLRGEQGGALGARGDQITLDLAPILSAVKARLVERGFGWAALVPEVERTVVLAQTDAVPRAQWTYRTLATLGGWLPGVTLVLLVAGVVLARDRRRTVVRGALGVLAAMAVLGAALALARTSYVATTPADVLDAQAAGTVFDTVVRSLRGTVRVVAAAALVLALAGFLAGPSAAAVRVRGAVGRGPDAAPGGAHGGRDLGPAGAWVVAHRRALELTTLLAGGAVLLLWPGPTAWVVAGTASTVVLVLALVRLPRLPPQDPPTTTSSDRDADAVTTP